MNNYVSNPVNKDDEWSEFITKNTKETSDNLSNDLSTQNQDTVETRVSIDSVDNDTDDEWCEVTERPSGVMDILLQQPDITQDGDKIISFAPGEGNRPLGIFVDKDAEFLSFPTIYCDKRQADNSERLVPVHYSTISAETSWIHLIKILGRLIDNKHYTDDEVKQMTWQKKSELIQKDPVTCARNFEHMVQLFIHNFIKSSCHPIGEVFYFFYIVLNSNKEVLHISMDYSGSKIHASMACEEAEEGNKNIVNKVRHSGNKFLNALEISAQEAVYFVMQMPLTRSSREFQFINTSDPGKRTFLLKSMDKIKELPDHSVDIESDNIIKRYQRRPKELENLCLADFVAWFNCKNDSNQKSKLKSNSSLIDDYRKESNFDDNVDDDLSDEEQKICENVQDIESEENLVASNTQHRDEQDREIGPKASELFGCFDPGKDKQHAQYDLINDIALIRYLNSQPQNDPDNVSVVKVAPTGKAAINIRRNTLHSAFKIPANTGFNYCTLDRDRLNTIRSQLQRMQVIFTDEISMNSKDDYAALATNPWQQYFQMFELSEVMRQSEDKELAEIVNRIREGNHTEDDMELLKERILNISPQHPDYPIS
ncbi:ATP-dependent DNA helicase PIF1 [Paramuricea clavata]|uniref:ATP-dependent DNA helicase n=1 Tax=Paramuricea clavata TaxID=317549 RepID=A0A7D9DYA6_PARCT|nr:ATP-dependent DNA helicase PIF1 [Paramuricea clavata]